MATIRGAVRWILRWLQSAEAVPVSVMTISEIFYIDQGRAETLSIDQGLTETLYIDQQRSENLQLW